MKKKALLFLFIVLIVAVLTGCSKRETEPVISFDAGGGTTVGDCKNVVESFPYSRRDGYKIDGWFVDENYSERAIFPYYAAKDTVLHARWVSVEEGNNEIEYERVEGGRGFYAVSLNTKSYSVCIPDTHLAEPVYGIKRGFLTNKSYVDTLVLGKYVNDVQDDLTRYTNLSTIEVNADSEYLKVEYGALVDKTTNTLVAYPLKRKTDVLTLDCIVTGDVLRYNSVVKTVVLKDNASIVGTPFRYMSNLSTITVEDGNGTLTTENGILYSKDKAVLYACPAGRKMTEFVIPSGVKEILDGSLENEFVTKITLGKDVEKYADYSYTPALTEFAVDKDNIYFSARNGMLFTKDGKKLVRYPQGAVGKAIVPDGTEEIGIFAFTQSGKMTAVDLPASLKKIDGYAFEGCGLLSTVTFAQDSMIEEIKDSAFSGCHDLAKMTMTSRKPPETGSFLFDSLKENSGFKLVIPANAREIYAYYWSFAYEYLDATGFPLTTYTVSFITDGGTEIAPIHGVFIRDVATPKKTGMIFAGWYADENKSLASYTTFPMIITDHLTLYAEWEYDLTPTDAE